MGCMNSECRYLHTLDSPVGTFIRLISQPGQILEILMRDLHPAGMDQFYVEDGVTAKDAIRRMECVT